MNDSQSLASDIRTLLTQRAGEPGPDAIMDLGGWDRVAADITTLVNDPDAGTEDDPTIVALVELIARDISPDASEVGSAVVSAVLRLSSVTGFTECTDALICSPSLVASVGPALADGLQDVVDRYASTEDPTLEDITRTAHALESVTQLRIGEVGRHYSLLASLERFTTVAPPRLGRAVIRSVAAAVDYWPTAIDLVDIVKVQAGILPQTGTPSPEADPEALESDASWALASIQLITALRASTPLELRERLDETHELLKTGADTYEREDSAVFAPLIDIVRAVAAGTDRTLLATQSLPSAGDVEKIVEKVINYNVTTSGLNHWYADVKRQTVAAWTALAGDLVEARDAFAEQGFYRPEQIIDRLLQIYLASRSAAVVRNDADFGAVLDIVQPVIEGGFASKAAFLANLDQYTHELADRIAGEPDEDAKNQFQALHDTATRVFSAAAAAAQRGDPPGKGTGGTGSAPLPRQLEQIVGAGTPEAIALGELDTDLLQTIAAAVENKTTARNVSLTERRVLENLQPFLDACPDYTVETMPAVDHVLLLLIRFASSRLDFQSDRMPYLFSEDATEQNLHDDLHDYLRSTLGPSVEMEVTNVAGGRVDIRVKFDGFALHLELKVDSTAKPLADKAAYVKQAVSYQASDIRIGFLVALRLRAFPPGPSPHLTSMFTPTTFDVPGDTQSRHIICLDIPGNRTKPSAMRAK